MARAPREVRRLLMKALREPDPERATELFLAARLLHTQLRMYEKDVENIRKRIREIRETLQTLLRNPSK